MTFFHHPAMPSVDEARAYVEKSKESFTRAELFRTGCEIVLKVFLGSFIIGVAVFSMMPA